MLHLYNAIFIVALVGAAAQDFDKAYAGLRGSSRGPRCACSAVVFFWEVMGCRCVAG